MTPENAVKAGALALFGEKYGEEVRVVSMGGVEDGGHFSTELCGGTHVRRTGDIGAFKILSESAVASGVRRIEALTGIGAEKHAREQEALVAEAAAVLKTKPADLPARIASLVEERRKLERELTEARKKAMVLTPSSGQVSLEGQKPEFSVGKDVGGVTFVSRLLDGVPAKELKGMVDEMKKQIGSGVVVLLAREEGRASLVVGVTADLTGRVNAVELVKAGSKALGGQGGGGRPDMAQAGGPNAAAAEAALTAIEQALANLSRAA
jgi:alanyl-tRNA synthetase